MKKLSLKHGSFGAAGVGGISLLVATFFDTAPNGTHNIGLMQEQMLWSQFAALCLLGAAVLLVGSYLGAKLDRIMDNRQP